MPILQTRGPKTGPCNICGTLGPLTEDHTPPKGYAPGVPLQISHIAERLGSERATRHAKAPDGVKFRSLCHRCNSDLLGTQYDPSLIDMAKQVVGLISSELLLPATISVRVKPQLVARSVLGHMAAQGIDRYEKGEITEPLRDYILDPTLPMMPGMRMHYWVYPHRGRVLIRDAVITTLGDGRDPSMIWLMKAFPLAFAVLWNESYRFEGFSQPRDFDAYARLAIDDVVDLPIDLHSVPHELWPEAPSENTVLMMGQQAVMATVSPPRGRVLKIKK